MANIILRFDMLRAPFADSTNGALYRAALDMCAWADRYEIDGIGLSEHHITKEGFLPAPLTMAAAIIARTHRVAVSVGALLANLYDPLHLAEQIATLDLISEGRFGVAVGLGYREVEYQAFGIDWLKRGELLTRNVDLLVRALRGETIVVRGVETRLAPLPESNVMRLVAIAGNSAPAARRAARLGLALLSAIDDPEIGRVYSDECKLAGFESGGVIYPNQPSTTLIDEDPERAWAEVGPYLLHHARTYAEWAHPNRRAYAESKADTLGELRREGKYRILTPDEAIQTIRESGSLHLAPITAGIAPEIGWRTLELYASKVLPQLAG